MITCTSYVHTQDIFSSTSLLFALSLSRYVKWTLGHYLLAVVVSRLVTSIHTFHFAATAPTAYLSSGAKHPADTDRLMLCRLVMPAIADVWERERVNLTSDFFLSTERIITRTKRKDWKKITEPCRGRQPHGRDFVLRRGKHRVPWSQPLTPRG